MICRIPADPRASADSGAGAIKPASPPRSLAVFALTGFLLMNAGCSPDAQVEGGADVTRNTGTAVTTEQTTPLDGQALFDLHCASCHLNPGTSRAPSIQAMSKQNPAALMFALTNGRMKGEAESLSTEEKIRLAGFLGSDAQDYEPPAAALCRNTDIDLDGRISRWGFDSRNSGRIADTVSRIHSGNVARLEVAWAFGLPQSADARSQPVITSDTLFIAAVSGHVFALDRFTGCIKWHYRAPVGLRTALTLALIGSGGSARALFFGDADAHVNALDPATGRLLWRVDARVGEHSLLTGAIVAHEGRLIVPVSLYEVALARNPDYECCRTHGAVLSLAAKDGTRLWSTHTTPEATPRGKTAHGTLRYGPSGVPVWSTPTVDAQRGVIYVGTGQNASAPATRLSDSVLALDIANGGIVWHFQALAGDAYNDSCSEFPTGPNCPTRAGPDFDIGASVILTSTPAGNDLLLVGQKSGDVYALDPDREGAQIWHRRVGAGSALGGVHWGMAAADGRLFAPVSDPVFPIPRYFPKPGLYALAIEDGELLWEQRVERGCETSLRDYFSRSDLYPQCSFYFGLSAAATAVNDLVFAPALDGKLRAFAAGTGTIAWVFDTARSFPAVNGVEAHGGSMDVAGVQLAGNMLYVQSGYSLFGQLPGNLLLAFRLAD